MFIASDISSSARSYPIPPFLLHRAPIPEEEPLPGEEDEPDEEEPPPHPDPSGKGN
ncbi:MAG: hypothetical protein HYS18_13710 [Burkholderiales bacterium]|nr:hypothetical protein [Burkholderiales bacterium]